MKLIYRPNVTILASSRGPKGDKGDPGTAGALDDLSNVDTSGATDGQSLAYDADTETWKPRSSEGSGDMMSNVYDPAEKKEQVLTVSDANNFQPKNTQLTAIAAQGAGANKLPYYVNSTTAALADLTAAGRALLDDADAAAQRATLGLVIGTNVQAQDAELTAIAGLTSAADKLPYFTGLGTAGLTTMTSFARSLLDDADAAAMRDTLGITEGGGGSGDMEASVYDPANKAEQVLTISDADDFEDAGAAAAAVAAHVGQSDPHAQYLKESDAATTYQPVDADLTALAGLSTAANKLPYFTGTNTAGLADLTAAGRALLDDADAAAQRTTLGLGTAAVAASSDFASASGLSTEITNRTNADDDLQDQVDAITASKGANNGIATLDSGGKVPTSQLPSSVLGTMSYQGTWNASTNTPTLADGTGTKGHYYVVTTAGSTTIDGENDWKIKDWIVFNGVDWEKVDNTDSVVTVNGSTGAVVLDTGDISENGNLYFTDERAQDAVGSILTDTATIDMTYNDGSGTITADVKDSSLGTAKLGGDITAAGKALLDDADAAAQRTTLGVVIGTDVQAQNARLTDISSNLSATSGTVEKTGANTFGVYTVSSAGKALIDDADAAAQRTTMGVVIGTDVQAQNARLQDIASNLSGASGLVEKTGANTFGVVTVTAAGKALLDDADAAAQRTTLGLGTAATTAASDYATASGLSTEITNRGNADTALQDQIDDLEAGKVNILSDPAAIGGSDLVYWYEAPGSTGWAEDMSESGYTFDEFWRVLDGTIAQRRRTGGKVGMLLETTSYYPLPSIAHTLPCTIYMVLNQTGTNTGTKNLLKSTDGFNTTAVGPQINIINGQVNVTWGAENFTHSHSAISGWNVVKINLTSSQIAIAYNGEAEETEAHSETADAAWVNFGNMTYEGYLGALLIFNMTVAGADDAAVVSRLRALYAI